MDRAIAERFSCRAFDSERAIPAGDLRAVLENMRRSPTAGNLEAYHVLVYESAALRAAFPSRQPFVRDASAILVFVALREHSARKYGARGRELYAVQDATIACTTAMLAASARGIASCWIGAFDTAAVAEFCGLQTEERCPVAVLPLGYPPPGHAHRISSRRPLEDTVSFH